MPTAEEMPRKGLRTLVLHGVAWNGAYHVFSIVIQFATMLVMVRLLSPVDFGRVTAVIGLLHVLNAFGCSTFMAHALQLPAEEDPDWTLHWHCGLWIQVWLASICVFIGAILLFLPSHRELAPLLFAASVGLLLDTPSRLRLVQLHRTLNFRRLRIVGAVSTLLSIVTTLGLATLGMGALALVVGGNVVVTFGYTIDLLLVAGWRPRGPWWCWPTWAHYRPALRFGFMQGGAGVLRLGRNCLAAFVLPVTIGYEALGLLGRAEALFASTVQRLTGLVSETLYPVLPQCATDEARFQRVASAYHRSVTILLINGGVFLALRGAHLSNLLYGPKWVEANPLITPQVVAGALAGIGAVSYRLLLARNRVTICLRLDAAALIAGVPVVLWTFAFPDAHVYAYGLAAAAAFTTTASLALARDEGLSGAFGGLVPPAVAAAVGGLAIHLLEREFGCSGVPALMAQGAVYLIACTLSLRLLFPSYLAGVVSLLPGGRYAMRALLLPTDFPTGAGLG